MDNLSSWLAELGLERYTQVFADNGVDLETLRLLSESEWRSWVCCSATAPVYNWFTEGFDTKDLKEAKALLEELRA